jgi:hypothetical protein
MWEHIVTISSPTLMATEIAPVALGRARHPDELAHDLELWVTSPHSTASRGRKCIRTRIRVMSAHWASE